jgi:1,4-dihydroxy-2-naphthoate polyprenyltransferase
MRVLIVLGHPRAESLGGALAAAYADGAREADCEVEELHLGRMNFALDVTGPSPRDQPLEPDLERARMLIEWAEHLVFVFPNWWGTMPARMKGFLDRILLPGFAFREKDGHYYGLLTGRTAELITTMDVPPLVNRWILGAPGRRAMNGATLGLCGIRSVRSTAFSPASHTDPDTRRRWIREARGLGARLAEGPRRPLRRVAHRVGSWLKAVRPQFLPMTLLAYAAGALMAGASLSWDVFVLGLVCMVFLQVTTVLVNDIHDRASDASNLNWGPFTGGGRSLQEGGKSLPSLRRGAGITLSVSLLAGMALVLQAARPLAVLAVLVPLGALALAYTAPPFKLSHRGFGELDVALTHGPGVVVFAYVVQGGALLDPWPWLLGLVIGLAVLPAIVLSGIPDRTADRAAGKRTLAVRLGTAGAARLALILTLVSATGALLLALGSASLAGWLPVVTVPHALLLVHMIRRFTGRGAPERRIDGLMAAALLYIGWFVIVPLAGLL